MAIQRNYLALNDKCNNENNNGIYNNHAVKQDQTLRD